MAEFTRDEEIRMFALDRAANLHKGLFVFTRTKKDQGEEDDGPYAEAAVAAGCTLAVAAEFERFITGRAEDGGAQ